VITLVILISVLFFAGRYGSFENFRGKINVAKQYLNNPGIIDSTSTFNDNSVFERILLWRNSLRMISDHPLTGVGMNNWKLLQPQYGIGGTPFINTGMVHFEHPHNDFLLILCEQGPMGLILYIAFFVFLIVKSLQFSRSSEDVRVKRLLACLCFSLVAFAVLSFFGFPRSRFYVMLLLMFYAALILIHDPEKRAAFSNRTQGYRLFLIVSLGISVNGMYAAWSRFQGEVHTREILKAQFAKNFARMDREADKAASWYYRMDHTATPLVWYKGMAQFYSGNINAAIPLYERALAMNPNHLRIINDLATCYERNRDYPKAIETYRAGLKIAPFFTEGLLNLSATYYNSGLKDSALSAINRVQLLKISYREKVNYDLYLNTILETMAVEYVDSNFTSLKAEEMKGRIRKREFGLPELYKNSIQSGESFSRALDSLLKTKAQ
jgi:tetratricopeptide (TPR) repeat protein